LGGIRQDARVVARYFESPPSEINTLQAVRRRIIAAAVEKQPETAIRGPGKRGPVTRVARDRLFQKGERFRDLPRRRPNHRVGAQIEVVGGQIGGRAADRTRGFGRL
jgi:hypothetical protein